MADLVLNLKISSGDALGTLKQVQTAIAAVTKEVGGTLPAQVSNFTEKFAKIGLVANGIQSLAGSFSTLSQPLVELDAGLRNIGTLGVKNFKDFETAALDLSRSFPDNAAVIANAVADAVGSGLIKTNEAGKINIAQAKDFAAQASKLAVAGATDIGTAVKGLGSVINSYGTSLEKYGDVSKQAAYVSDILFNTYNQGVISVGELASNLSQVTGIAATAGVGIDQIGASIATLTKQGAQGGVATTRVRALIQEILAGKDKLAPVTKELAQQFKALEGPIASTGKMYDKTRTLQENLKAGNITLQDVAAGIGKVAAQQGKEVTNIFGSIEAAQAVLALSGSNAKAAFEDLENIGKRGSVAEGFEVQADSIENKMKMLVNSVNAGFVTIFKGVGGGATAALGALSQLAPALGALSGIQSLIPDSAFKAMQANLKALPSTFASVKGSAKDLALSFSGEIGKATQKASESLRGLPSTLAGVAKDSAASMSSTLVGGFKNLPQMLSSTIASSRTALMQLPAAAGQAIGGFLADTAKSTGQAVGSIFSTISTTGGKAAGALVGLFTAPLATLSAGFTALGSVASTAWAAITGPVGITVAAIVALGVTVYALYSNFDNIKTAVNDFINSIISVAEEIGRNLKPLLSDMGGLLKEIASLIIDVVVGAFKILTSIITAIVGGISGFVSSLFGLRSETQKTGESTSFLTRAVQFLQSVIQAAQNNIAGMVAAIRSIKTAVGDVVNSLTSGNIAKAFEVFSSAPTKAADAFKTGFQSKEVSRTIEQAFAGLDSTVAKLGESTKKSLDDAIKGGRIDDAKGIIAQRLQSEIDASKRILQIQTASGEQRKELEQRVAEKQNELRKKAADDIEALLSKTISNASDRVTGIEALRKTFEAIKVDFSAEGDAKAARVRAQALIKQTRAEYSKDRITLKDSAELSKEIEEFKKILGSQISKDKKSRTTEKKAEVDYTDFVEAQEKRRAEIASKTAANTAEARIKALDDQKTAIEQNENLTAQSRIIKAKEVEEKIIKARADVSRDGIVQEQRRREATLREDLSKFVDSYKKVSSDQIAEFVSNTDNLQEKPLGDFLAKSTTLSKEKIAEVVASVTGLRSDIVVSTQAAQTAITETTTKQLSQVNKLAASRLPKAILEDELKRINASVANEVSRAAQVELAQLKSKQEEEIALIEQQQKRIEAVRAEYNEKTALAGRYDAALEALETATNAELALAADNTQKKLAVEAEFLRKKKELQATLLGGADDSTTAISTLDNAYSSQLVRDQEFENRKTEISRAAAIRRNEILLEEFKRTGKLGDESVTMFTRLAGKSYALFEGIAANLRGNSGGDAGQRLAQLARAQAQELASEGSTGKKRIEIKKKYAEEQRKLEEKFSVKSTLENLRFSIADTFQGLAGDSLKTFAAATKGAQGFAEITGDSWAQLATSIAGTFASLSANGVSPFKAFVLAALNALDALIPVFVAMLTGQFLGQLGPAGVVLGAVATAGLYGLLAVAKGAVASAKFERGGLVTGGVQNGKTGRTIIVNERGNEFVMNHIATKKNLAALTAVNRRNITFDEYFSEQRKTSQARSNPEMYFRLPHFAPERVSTVMQPQNDTRLLAEIKAQTMMMEQKMSALESAMNRTAKQFAHNSHQSVEIVADKEKFFAAQKTRAARQSIG
jgi:TP901 family phage tail tape measure protein